jgi:hypothetical protein
MTYNTKFKPSGTPKATKERARNMTAVYWRVGVDDDLQKKFRDACAKIDVPESDMLRQMISYSLERIAA